MRFALRKAVRPIASDRRRRRVPTRPLFFRVFKARKRPAGYGAVVRHAGAWKFKLDAPLEHVGGSASSLVMPAEKATVVLKDAAGLLYEVPLSVSVVDDIVRLSGNSSLKVVAGGSVGSTLTVRYGADGMAAHDNLIVNGAEPIRVEGDVATYVLEHGVLSLNTATGKYSFAADGVAVGEADVRQTISFVAQDGDGDAASRLTTITVSKPPAPQFSLFATVGETGLDGAGSFGDTDFEIGAIAGLPEGWSIVSAGSTAVDYGTVVDNGALRCSG